MGGGSAHLLSSQLRMLCQGGGKGCQQEPEGTAFKELRAVSRKSRPNKNNKKAGVHTALQAHACALQQGLKQRVAPPEGHNSNVSVSPS